MYEIFDAYAFFIKVYIIFLKHYIGPPGCVCMNICPGVDVFSKEVLISFNFSMTFIKIIKDCMGQINIFCENTHYLTKILLLTPRGAYIRHYHLGW